MLLHATNWTNMTHKIYLTLNRNLHGQTNRLYEVAGSEVTQGTSKVLLLIPLWQLLYYLYNCNSETKY